MSALTVTAAEAASATSARAEMKQLMEGGSSEGTIAIMEPGQFDLGDPAKMAPFCEAVALAIMRMPLPTYTTLTVPSASTAGRLIYVTNGAAGLPVVAFSDGSSWLRVDTRTGITAV